MKNLIFIWQLALTPFYYAAITVASLAILLAMGFSEARDFWSKNK